MVEMTGLEPAASWSQTKHSTNLNYISIKSCECLEHSQDCRDWFRHPAVAASSALEASPASFGLLFYTTLERCSSSLGGTTGPLVLETGFETATS